MGVFKSDTGVEDAPMAFSVLGLALFTVLLSFSKKSSVYVDPQRNFTKKYENPRRKFIKFA